MNELNQAKRAAFRVGIVMPLTLIVLGAVLQLIWMPRMPDPSAVHWDIAGRPDGFASPWFNFFAMTGISLAMLLLYLLLQKTPTWQRGAVAGGTRKPAPVWGPMNRLMPAIILGVVTMMQVMAIGAAFSQLDAEDAAQTGPILGLLIGSFILGAAVAGVSYALQPKYTLTNETLQNLVLQSPTGSEDTEFAEEVWAGEVWRGEVWRGEVRPSKVFAIVYGLGVLVMLGATVLVVVSDAPPAITLIMVATSLLVLFLGSISSFFKVNVDHNGIEARPVLGWPVFSVAADEVETVSVGHVTPFTEFGGWGLRWIPGGFGIVMRSGEAIVIKRKNGKTFTITIDDAEAAAKALLIAVKQSATR